MTREIRYIYIRNSISQRVRRCWRLDKDDYTIPIVLALVRLGTLVGGGSVERIIIERYKNDAVRKIARR